MVVPDSLRITRVLSYLGVTSGSLNFKYGTITLYGSTFQYFLLSKLLTYCDPATLYAFSSYEEKGMYSLGCSHFARHYLGNLC